MDVAERPALNFARVLTLLSAVPRIANFDRGASARLAYRLLTLPSLQRAGNAVLGSVRLQGRKPLIEWSQHADVQDLLPLIHAIPAVAARVGLLILNVLYRPPHASALRDIITRLAHDPDVALEVKRFIPILFKAPIEEVCNDRWEEVANLTYTEKSLVRFFKERQRFMKHLAIHMRKRDREFNLLKT